MSALAYRYRVASLAELAESLRTDDALLAEMPKVITAAVHASSRTAAWSTFSFDILEAGYRSMRRTVQRQALFGVPFGVKDIIDVRGYPSGCNSALYENYWPKFDAALVASLKRAGAIPAGKTVTTEFAYSYPGLTCNPWSTAHTPGGSSSGSAAVVAQGVMPFSLGTQTGGSIIRPAAYCGVVGFKPSRGLVSRSGIKALSETFDTVGWYTRTVDDCRYLADAILGMSDITMPPQLPSSVLVASDHELGEVSEAVQVLRHDAEHMLERAGVSLHRSDARSLLKDVHDSHAHLMAADMSQSLLSEYQLGPEKMSPGLKRQIAFGASLELSSKVANFRFLQKAERAWEQLTHQSDIVMAYSAGEPERGLSSTGASTFTRVWTAMGLPCIHLPLGYTDAGLPIGLQLVGKLYEDASLLRAAQALHLLLDKRRGKILADLEHL